MSVVALRERPAAEFEMPIADRIRPRLNEAEQVLADLRAQVGALALDKALNRPGAAGKLDKLNEQLAAAERDVSQIGAALEVAAVRDAAAAREAVHKVRLASLKDFQEALAVRTGAAKELADAIASATVAFQRFVGAGQSLSMLLPLGVTLDLNEMGLNEMAPSHLVEREFFRVGAKVDAQGLIVVKSALPGARSHNLMNLNNPGALPTLVDEVAAGTNNILSAVRDRVNALA